MGCAGSKRVAVDQAVAATKVEPASPGPEAQEEETAAPTPEDVAASAPAEEILPPAPATAAPLNGENKAPRVAAEEVAASAPATEKPAGLAPEGDGEGEPAPPAAAEEDAKVVTKCVSCKHGSGDKVTLAMTEADFTPAWLSNVLDTEVKSLRTKLCGQGQVGVTVLLLDIEYATDVDASIPTSLAVKMHGPAAEQRKLSAQAGLYYKEIFVYHDFDVATSVPLSTPEVLGIFYDARQPYEKLECFNLVMVNMNNGYDAFDMGAGQFVSQEEWSEIFAVCAKQHAQYWGDTSIQKPPLAEDNTRIFKWSPMEEALMMSVGPNKVVEAWYEAFKTHAVPRLGEEIMEAVQPCFDVADCWKGENSAKLCKKATARLTNAPNTLIHGDLNPGNFWKSKLGLTGDDKYAFTDWQVARMAPAACDLTTPQIGMYPGIAGVGDTMKAYYASLCTLKPEIATEYPYESFEMHVKCASIAFWCFIFAFVHQSTVVPSDTGEMDPDKIDYTWSKFMPAVFTMMGASFKELGLKAFCEELLAADE